MWIPPLISITIMLYVASAAIFVINYWNRSITLIAISVIMIAVANISLAAHIYFSSVMDETLGVP